MALGADVTLYHSIHYRVEISDPRKFETLVAVALRANVRFENVGHNGRLDSLAVVVGCDAEDDAEYSLARTANFEIPKQSQLVDYTELAIKLADNRV